MAFLFTSMIEFFVPTPQALASTFSRRVQRGLPMESPSRRRCQVTQVDRMARIAAERQKQKIGMLVQVTPAPSQTSDPNLAWTCLIRASRHSCHQGNITDPRFRFYYIVHSFHIFKRCICNCHISTLHITSQSSSHLIRYERQLTEVQRPAHEGLEAAACQTKPGEKNQDEP